MRTIYAIDIFLLEECAIYMSASTKVLIPISKLTPGMQLSEDLYTPKGLLLLDKSTTLDEKNIFRIKLYQIQKVYIYEDKHYLQTKESSFRKSLETLFEYDVSQNFDEFRQRYELHQKKAEDIFNGIRSGSNVAPQELTEIADLLMSTLRTRNELFSYLHKLRSLNECTYSHSLNVGILANVFAHWLKLDPLQIEELTIAGLLHDIGKTEVPKEILEKPEKLTDDEYFIAMQHPKYGYDILQNVDISDAIKDAVLLHHERIDGSGYPFGFKGKDIPFYAKVIGILDIYEAMTSERTYRERFSPFRVMKIFEQESYGLLDTELLYIFLENIAHNYLGHDVLLSDGRKAKIIFIHNHTPTRPIVQIGDEMVNLMFEPSITIDEIL